MDEGAFVSTRENPSVLGLPSGRTNSSGIAAAATSNKAMSNDLSQKASPTILDRFRALLKERDDDPRVTDDDVVPPPSTEEIVRLYELLLSELTFNSKPIITDLTIIAGEQREHGEGIADAICARIIEVPVEQKLPSLYLLDSIVKNISREYVRYFSTRLPEVFCEAYRQVHPSLYPSMRHLFGTWSTVFPQSVLNKIEAQLQFSPPLNHQSSSLPPLKASESPRPAHGIHVNPKYLEARRQFEHSTMDSNIQQARGTSSNVKLFGPKLVAGYNEYDSVRVEGTSSLTQRLNSTGGASRTSPALGSDKVLSSTARLARPSSPPRVGLTGSLSPSVDEFVMDNSPRRVVERLSPSRPVFDYGLGRVMGRDGETNEWQRRHWSGDNHQRLDSSAYNHSNGRDLQGPRALIDAYGNDRGKRTLNDKPLRFERLVMNGIDTKVPNKAWQNTEEEEYDWEDMSPTLADRSRSNDLSSSSISTLGRLRARPGLGPRHAVPLESDFRRSNWSSPAQLSVGDNSSMLDEDPSHGSMGKLPGFQYEPNQTLGSCHSREAWNIPQHLSRFSKNHFNVKGRVFHMPIPASGISSPAAEKMPSVMNKSPDSDSQFRRLSTAAPRMVSSSLNSTSLEDCSVVPSSTGAWPPVNVHKSQSPPLRPILPRQKQSRNQFDLMNARDAVVNQGPSKPLFLTEQQLDNVENKAPGSKKLPMLPNQLAGSTPLSQPNLQLSHLQQQVLPPETRENFIRSVAIPTSSCFAAQSSNHGYSSQGHGAFLLNQIPPIHPLLPVQNIPNSTSNLHGGTLPPLPPGPPPPSSQPVSQFPVVPNQAPGSAFSGLISSLMAQGLISFTQAAPTQDSVGVEFNPDILKVRHESAIRALYADLPRQCTTCGLRFKCQEEHSSHMDWHVTKNRISKNRKQKPSRKWFVSTSMWLSGAEALGTDSVPSFLPVKTIMEEKNDEELAVPADEDQNVCALCGEPFDDFYSDETDEWMYKGAVYMNAPNGSIEGMDKSQLGPIVHAKCRSESNVVSPEDFAQHEGGNIEEDSQRKRRRT